MKHGPPQINTIFTSNIHKIHSKFMRDPHLSSKQTSCYILDHSLLKILISLIPCPDLFQIASSAVPHTHVIPPGQIIASTMKNSCYFLDSSLLYAFWGPFHHKNFIQDHFLFHTISTLLSFHFYSSSIASCIADLLRFLLSSIPKLGSFLYPGQL